MVLWRISRHLELSGRGGVRLAGRWHHAGSPVVYLAESPAGALIEVCVHTSVNDIPPSFTLLKVAAPESTSNFRIDEIDLAALEQGWPGRVEVTRDLGSEWLKKGNAALLRVPSALVPETTNYLLNPLHADSGQFQIATSFIYPFDVRLKK
jgi:RES domain-containing protein